MTLRNDEVSRRDFIATLIGAASFLLLPTRGSASGSVEEAGGVVSPGHHQMSEFPRIMVRPENIVFGDGGTVHISEPMMVDLHTQSSEALFQRLKAWEPSINNVDVTTSSRLRQGVMRQHLNIQNDSAYTRLQNYVEVFDDEFTPLAASLMYARMQFREYPNTIQLVDQSWSKTSSQDGTFSYRPLGQSKLITELYIGPKGNISAAIQGHEFASLKVDSIETAMRELLQGEQAPEYAPPEHIVVLASGGPDSATAIAYARKQFPDALITPLYLQFGDGDDSSGEIASVQNLVKEYNLEMPEIVAMGGVRSVLGGHILVHSGATIVPFGNAFVLTFALAYAYGAPAEELWIGTHLDDAHETHEYSSEYFDHIRRLAEITLLDHAPRIVTPLVHLSKADTFRLGKSLGVDYSYTWSCMREQETHCGECGPCLARQRAFSIAGIRDMTQYRIRSSCAGVIENVDDSRMALVRNY